MNRASIAIACALLLGTAAFLWAPQSTLRRGARLLFDAQSSSAKPAPLRPVPIDAWSIGQQRRYDVELTSEIIARGEDKTTEIAMGGKFSLRLTPFARDERKPSEATIRARLDLRVLELYRVVDGAREDMKAAADRAFAAPAGLTLRSSGEVEKIYLESDMDPMLHGVVRTMLSGLQFVRAKGAPGAHEWSVVEQDISGRFLAGYRQVSELGFHKQSERYLDRLGGDDMFGERKRSSASAIALRADGIVAQVDKSHAESMASRTGGVESKTALHIRLRDVSQVDAAPLPLLASGGLALDELPQMKTPPADYEAIARNHSVGSLLRLLEELGGASAEQSMEAGVKLAAVLRVGGQRALDDAARAVRDTVVEEAAHVVLGALGGVGTKEAQRALADLARDRELGEMRRRGAMIHLSSSVVPTAETLSSLQSVATDTQTSPELREAAVLALGGGVYHADAADPNVHGAVDASLAFLLRNAEAARTAQERVVAADALGNTGNPGALAALQTALEDKVPHTRASAVLGLRFMQSEGVDRLIADTMLSDDAPKVRADALGALLYRDLTDESRSAVLDTLRGDEDIGVRLHAVNVAARHHDDEAIAAALAWASENDPDERVRERAQQALERQREQPN